MKQDIFDNLLLFKHLFINLSIISFVTFTNVESTLKIISLILAILYTLYKFCTDYYDRKNKKATKNRTH